jgi:hypothetical protein
MVRMVLVMCFLGRQGVQDQPVLAVLYSNSVDDIEMSLEQLTIGPVQQGRNQLQDLEFFGICTIERQKV